MGGVLGIQSATDAPPGRKNERAYMEFPSALLNYLVILAGNPFASSVHLRVGCNKMMCPLIPTMQQGLSPGPGERPVPRLVPRRRRSLRSAWHYRSNMAS